MTTTISLAFQPENYLTLMFLSFMMFYVTAQTKYLTADISLMDSKEKEKDKDLQAGQRWPSACVEKQGGRKMEEGEACF